MGCRFNPQARDDRVLPGYIASRRVHKAPKEVKSDIPAEEVIATDPSHVLSMDPSTRLDWFQMALLQAATGKLKATVLFDSTEGADQAGGDASRKAKRRSRSREEKKEKDKD